MRPLNAVIKEVIRETPTVMTLRFDIEPGGVPGQFLMVWIRGMDEIPMALSHPDGITVQRVGDASTVLSNMKIGDSIGIRGPFGNGFDMTGQRIMIIAGGVGGAPLLPLAYRMHSIGSDVTVLTGARTSDELLFEKYFAGSGTLRVATDDGSKGFHGVITDLMSEYDLEDYDRFYVCGPELMMKSVLDILCAKGLEDRSQFSLHRYFKCGIGICGSCAIDPSGLRVCRDGPVFFGDMLINSELGKYRRNASGQKKMF